LGSLDQADWALLAVAAYIAAVVLVRLMRAHRDLVLARVRSQIQQERERKLLEERKKQLAEAAEKKKAS
jgi:uncharacterized membrane protein